MLNNREFIVDQRLLSIRNTYVIKNKLDEQLGFIKQEFLSWGPHFWLEDNSGNHLGEIDGKVLTVHHEYEIKDKDNQVKARIKKKILKLIGSDYICNQPQLIGSGGVSKWNFKALKPGKTIISFQYSRSWEKGIPPIKIADFEVTVR